jgi:hypothetical protein
MGSFAPGDAQNCNNGGSRNSPEVGGQGRLFDDLMHMCEYSDIVLGCCADKG